MRVANEPMTSAPELIVELRRPSAAEWRAAILHTADWDACVDPGFTRQP